MMGRNLIASAIAVLLLSLPCWGKKKTPDFSTIEITRFSKEGGVELTPNFLDYLYQELFEWVAHSGMFEQIIGQNEIIPASQARRSLTLRGTILEYGKGSFGKSLIGFGVGRRSLEARVTLIRRMDNATVFETEIKVRSKRASDEKYLAIYLGKEVAKKIKNNTKQIHAALRAADKRYVPPPAETKATTLPTQQPASRQESASAKGSEKEAADGSDESPESVAPARADATPSETEVAGQEPPEEPGTVLVSSTLPGAEVYIDDGFVGNTPAKIKLSPGKHAVRVVMVGQEDWVRELSVLAGSELKVSVIHTPQKPPPEAPKPAPNPKALSKDDILGLLNNYVPNSRIAALVREHGIKFTPTPADLNEIAAAGGSSDLLEALRRAAPPSDR